MKIGFDAKRAFQNRTGLGNYSRTLIANLKSYFPKNEYVYFTPRKQTQYVHLFEKDQVIFPPGKNPLWRSFGIKKDIKNSGIDVFHGLSNELPFGMDIIQIPSVVTIHDVIFDIVPEDFPWHDRLVYRLKTQKCIRESSKIVAISQATRQDLIDRFGADPSKVEVIYQPIDRQFDIKKIDPERFPALKRQYHLPDRYLLYVGALMKRKNILPMIQAWQRLSPEHAIPLLIFGEGKSYKKELIDYIRSHRLSDHVQLRSSVPFGDLPYLYRLAECVLYPSLYEGFGLPVAEALACGSRVVTSSVSSMPEAGGELPRYVNPWDVDSIAEGIESSLQHSRPDPADVAKHLSRFDSFKVTEQIMNVYRELYEK